jgi:hypothetical protein
MYFIRGSLLRSRGIERNVKLKETLNAKPSNEKNIECPAGFRDWITLSREISESFTNSRCCAKNGP